MDPELVKRAQHGDERAFEALVVMLHPRLFRAAHGMLRQPELAEGATQRAFLGIWRFLPRLHDRSHVLAWSMRQLVAVCWSESAETLESIDEDAEVSGSSALADPFGTFLDRDQISRGFRQLPFDDRAVLVLRYLVDLDATGIAVALGVRAGSVEARTEAALERLATALDGDPAGGADLTPAVEGA